MCTNKTRVYNQRNVDAWDRPMCRSISRLTTCMWSMCSHCTEESSAKRRHVDQRSRLNLFVVDVQAVHLVKLVETSMRNADRCVNQRSRLVVCPDDLRGGFAPLVTETEPQHDAAFQHFVQRHPTTAFRGQIIYSWNQSGLTKVYLIA